MRSTPRSDAEVNAFFQTNGIELHLITRKQDGLARYFRVSVGDLKQGKTGVSVTEHKANRILGQYGLTLEEVLYADRLEMKQAAN